MRQSSYVILASILVLLGGCGGSGPVADEANSTATLPDLVNAAAATPPPPADGSRPENVAAARDSEPVQPAARLPAFLHGRWGMTPPDCTSTRGDAKGLLIIGADGLRFYESRAVPAGNLNTSDNSFSADFAFSGEGQTWTSFQTLQLQDRRLVRTTSNPMASYTYAKCS
jgi:hypothetical protein